MAVQNEREGEKDDSDDNRSERELLHPRVRTVETSNRIEKVRVETERDRKEIFHDANTREDDADCSDDGELRTEETTDCFEEKRMVQVHSERDREEEKSNIIDTLEEYCLTGLADTEPMVIAVLHNIQKHVQNNQQTEEPRMEESGCEERTDEKRSMECGDIIVLVRKRTNGEERCRHWDVL
jgi:hypothetical protein